MAIPSSENITWLFQILCVDEQLQLHGIMFDANSYILLGFQKKRRQANSIHGYSNVFFRFYCMNLVSILIIIEYRKSKTVYGRCDTGVLYFSTILSGLASLAIDFN